MRFMTLLAAAAPCLVASAFAGAAVGARARSDIRHRRRRRPPRRRDRHPRGDGRSTPWRLDGFDQGRAISDHPRFAARVGRGANAAHDRRGGGTGRARRERATGERGRGAVERASRRPVGGEGHHRGAQRQAGDDCALFAGEPRKTGQRRAAARRFRLDLGLRHRRRRPCEGRRGITCRERQGARTRRGNPRAGEPARRREKVADPRHSGRRRLRRPAAPRNPF